MKKNNQLFFNEAAIATTMDGYILLPEHELYEQDEKEFSKYNLYFILSGDKYLFEDRTPEFCYLTKQIKYTVNGHIGYLKTDNHFLNHYYGVSKRQYGKENRIVSFVLDKKYKHKDSELDNYLSDSEGNSLYQTSGFNAMIDIIARQKSLTVKFDILYIGQSGGVKSNRNSIIRLKDHKKLQMILSDYRVNHSNKDIYILAIKLGVTQPLIYNAMSKAEPKYSINHLSPNKNQIINIVEAMLIYHFQPQFNEKLKRTFPLVLTESYKQFFKLDYWNISFDYYLNDKNDVMNYLEFYGNKKVMKPLEIISYSLRKGSTPNELGVFYYSSPHISKKDK